MFRKMLRSRQQLPQEECVQLLKSSLRGVLCVLGDDDYPYGLPINHFYCEEDGRIYFHSGRAGHKTDALRRHEKASFCVFDEGFKREGEWALNIRSVVVFGRVEIIEDRQKVYDITRRLSRKFTGDEAYIEREIEKSGPAAVLLALTVEHMTGKLVNEA